LHDHATQNSASLGLTSPLQRPAIPAVIFFCGVVLTYWLIQYQDFVLRWMEDVPVYARAIANWQTGRDPYSTARAGLYFLYPPFFLYVARILSWLVPASWAGALYAALHTVATCALPLVLARYFFRQAWLTPLFALLLFSASPFFTGVLALCSGNVASTLYCLAFLAAAPGLRRNIWIWFYLAVLLAALVKITFLALLLLPLLVGRRQWLGSILCSAAVVGANLLEMRLLPELYVQYRWSLVHGIVGERAYGYGVFGIVAAYGYKLHIPAQAGAYVAAAATAVGLVGLMMLLRRRLDRFEQRDPGLGRNSIWLALVVVTIILVNPREMHYDTDIALFAAYLLWVYGLRTRRLLVLMVALFVPSLFVPLLVKAPHLYGMYSTFEILVAFGLAYWRLWREAGSTYGVSTDEVASSNGAQLSAVPGS
jgi:hypothetical protein